MSFDNIINNSIEKEYYDFLDDSKDKNLININEQITSVNNDNNNDFKEKMGKIYWEHIEQNTFHLKQEIERIWYLMKKLSILLLLHNQGHYPLIFIKGKDTENLGNIFRGNFYGNFPFVAKVNKLMDYPEFRKIEWLFFLRNKYYMCVKLELFKVTEDNSTSILKKVKYEKKELFNEMKTHIKLSKKTIFDSIEALLKNEPINLVMYESGLINGKMEDIWDIITDFSKLSAIAPNNNFPANINLRKMQLRKKEPFTIKYKNELIECLMELNYREENPGWNKWLIICDYFKINSDEKEGKILFQLTKISNNLCQLTIVGKYFTPKNAEEFQEISQKTKYVIISVKDYFENFFSPNNFNESK